MGALNKNVESEALLLTVKTPPLLGPSVEAFKDGMPLLTGRLPISDLHDDAHDRAFQDEPRTPNP